MSTSTPVTPASAHRASARPQVLVPPPTRLAPHGDSGAQAAAQGDLGLREGRKQSAGSTSQQRMLLLLKSRRDSSKTH